MASQWQGPQHGSLTAPGPASTAVVAALSFWDYSLVTPPGTGSDTYKATGRCFSVAAGRVSFVHGFKGVRGRLCSPSISSIDAFEHEHAGQAVPTWRVIGLA